jgi:DNA-binding NtrC family response regulator
MADDASAVPSRVVTTPDPLAPPLHDAATRPPDPDESETWGPAMRELLAKAGRVAPCELAILVTGESGVGKGRLARWLHAHSRRAGQMFVPVNCGTIFDTLLDTYLFGHARDAFTDRRDPSLGMFEAASEGTVFLNHIDEASPALQVKLLRVIEERQVQRVGEWHLRPINVRVITATNRNLEKEVARGRFRKDLFYRLRVVDLHIPALRERRGDLPVLARDLLRRAAARHQRPITGYAPQALACLLRYDWPGNVRELEHVIEAACQAAITSEIQMEDLPDTVRLASVARSPTARRRRTSGNGS